MKILIMIYLLMFKEHLMSSKIKKIIVTLTPHSPCWPPHSPHSDPPKPLHTATSVVALSCPLSLYCMLHCAVDFTVRLFTSSLNLSVFPSVSRTAVTNSLQTATLYLFWVATLKMANISLLPSALWTVGKVFCSTGFQLGTAVYISLTHHCEVHSHHWVLYHIRLHKQGK